MTHTRIPLVAFVVGLVFVLGSMGIAYGLWSETLVVDGSVYTGEVSAGWTSCICTDVLEGSLDPQPRDYGLPMPYPYPEWEHKDVGKTSCAIDNDDPRILHLTIDDGYPSYWGNCEVHYANDGTVPIIVRGFSVVPENFTLASKNGAEDGEIWVNYWGRQQVGDQLEPCPTTDPYFCEEATSMQFHVEQPALENHTYNFDVLVCVAQWNESPTLTECLEWAP